MSAAAAEKSVAGWLERAEDYLRGRDVSETRANAEFLMAEVLGVKRSAVAASAGRELTDRQGREFWEYVKKRGKRLPLAYVLGTQPFLDLEIKVTPSVLIPRPETEELVQAALETARTRFPAGTPLHAVDIGTGSGCVAVALARHLPQATVYATEVSEAAIKIAEENARRNEVSARIRFLREDLFKPRQETAPWADLVVSNPPYIPSAEVPKLEAEVLAEPALALDGGPSGLDAIKAIAAYAPRLLKPGGWIHLEFGFGQGPDVRSILEGLGFRDVSLRKDLQGRERIAVSQLQ